MPFNFLRLFLFFGVLGNCNILYEHCKLFSQLCNWRDVSKRVLVLRRQHFMFQFFHMHLELPFEFVFWKGKKYTIMFHSFSYSLSVLISFLTPLLQFLHRHDPKRIAENLKSTENEESCSTYNMLKVHPIIYHFISSCHEKLKLSI